MIRTMTHMIVRVCNLYQKFRKENTLIFSDLNRGKTMKRNITVLIGWKFIVTMTK